MDDLKLLWLERTHRVQSLPAYKSLLLPGTVQYTINWLSVILSKSNKYRLDH